ncbi:DUF1800 domain-containing protein [Alcaligenaceae bacterium]|nr:DUF1800 domain-containing protein [Alcaligenaceae bacterium]
MLRILVAAVCGCVVWASASPQAMAQQTSTSHQPKHTQVKHNDAQADKPTTQQLALEQIALINRLTWGVTPALAASYSKQGEKAFIQRQLTAQGKPLPKPVQAVINDMAISGDTTVLTMELYQLRKTLNSLSADDPARDDARKALQQRQNALGRETQQRYLLRALYSPDQLQEKMTWFWMNHFNIFLNKSPYLRPLLADFEEQAIRPYALGKFKDLLSATMHHPAMLIYLDNNQNRAGKINENYGRELLELHTLGVGGGYTQKDVTELSRSLTGLGINLTGKTPKPSKRYKNDYVRNGIFEFNPARHDYKDKRILGHVIQGRGLAEIDEVVELLASHPSTAKHISRELAVYFVSDNPSDALVSEMSKAFLKNDGDIAKTLNVMFQSQEFQASLSKNSFKDPVEYVLASTRLMHSGEDRIVDVRLLQSWLARMGEPLYGRRTPDGYPIERDAWQNSGQMLTRFESARFFGGPAAALYVPYIKGEKPPKRAVPEAARQAYNGILRNGISAETRKTLEQAKTTQEWNTLLLSSPDFMNH